MSTVSRCNTVSPDTSAPQCHDSDALTDEEINAVEQRGDWISPDGVVQQGGVSELDFYEDPPLEAPDPHMFFGSSLFDDPPSGSGGGSGGPHDASPFNPSTAGSQPDEPTIASDATIPEHLQPPKPLTVAEAYRQANGQPVAGVAVEGTLAAPLSPFGFGGGVSGSIGLTWDRFGGVGITMGASVRGGWGLEASVGLNASVTNGGTIHGDREIWQNSGGVAIAAGPLGVDFQPGQVEGGLGIGVGLGVGAWGQANTQTTIPIIEPTLVFVNGELLPPKR